MRALRKETAPVVPIDSRRSKRHGVANQPQDSPPPATTRQVVGPCAAGVSHKTSTSPAARRFVPGCMATATGNCSKSNSTGADGGYRDDYIPINFKGWKRITCSKPALNTIHYDRVRRINFYYNGMPKSKTVSCLIDGVEAIVEEDDKETAVVLEDFENADLPLFGAPRKLLQVRTLKHHGITPARFGLIATTEAAFFDTSIRCDETAGLRIPRFDGVPAKRSDRVKRSYFFLTGFKESQFDEALAIAKRGGFDTILILQSSWCESTGHFKVNRKNFPTGLAGLKRTVRRFKEAGFHVGFHFLAASIYPPDEYLTPIPDARLVTKATVPLASNVDASATFIPTSVSPKGFPVEDGGYMGDGTIIRIGDELVKYGTLSLKKPYGFRDCVRGHLGTKRSSHQAGDPRRPSPSRLWLPSLRHGHLASR